MSTYEVPQATGARSSIVMAKETNWGVARPSSRLRLLNTIPGETLDQNIALYRSNVLRPDRTRIGSVRGSVRPGGVLPFELAPKGVSQLFWHALGGSVSVAGPPFYQHDFAGSVALPTGFSLEKKFDDLEVAEKYVGLLGCRVNSIEVNFNVDQIVTGTADIMAREFTAPSATSIFGSNPLTDMSSDPFTAVQVYVYEAGSATPLATAKSLRLRINNNLFGDNFALGNNRRINLKPGVREIDIDGTFVFNDWTLYEKAINGTVTSIQAIVDDGTYAFDFLFSNVNLLPNNSAPKVSTPGPIEIPMIAECLAVSPYPDIHLVITSPETLITD
jgi:hypothetical protein